MTSSISPSENLAAMQAMIVEAASAGAVMYFAPEMALLLDRDRVRAREHMIVGENHRIIQTLCNLAQAHNIWLHIGSVPFLPDVNSMRPVNRSLIIDNQGIIIAQYDKMHLFDVALSSGESWKESAGYDAGKGPVTAATPLGLMGLSICYDLRFPDLFSHYAKRGVQILAVPAAFTPFTGAAHWHTLLRARAIENASFVIAAAQTGAHADGRMTYGHSLVVDPWGDILVDMGTPTGLAFAEIDLDRLTCVRAQIPVHDNRRPMPTE